jgi:hypothetical protein
MTATRPPETIDEAEHMILTALREEPTVSLKSFDDGCDPRLLSHALTRLTRAGLVDITNGHIQLARPALHRHTEEATVNAAVLTRIAVALERIADRLPVQPTIPTPKPLPLPPRLPKPTPVISTGPVMPRRPAGRPRKPKPGDSKRIAKTMETVLDLLSSGPATGAELREVLLDEQRQLLYPAMVRAVERGLVTCHWLGKLDRYTLNGARRRTA